MEADISVYAGHRPHVNGYLSEGSGENLFIVRNGVIYHAARQLRASHTRLGAGATSACPCPSRPAARTPYTSPTKSSSPEPPPKSRPSTRRQPGSGRLRPHHKTTRRQILRNSQRTETRPLRLAHASQRERRADRLGIVSQYLHGEGQPRRCPFVLLENPGLKSR